MQRKFVVTIDSHDERGIRSVECFVWADSSADAKLRVQDWLGNIYYNNFATKVRELSKEEGLELSPKFDS